MSLTHNDLKAKLVASLNAAHRQNDTGLCQELSSNAAHVAALSDTAYECGKVEGPIVSDALILIGHEPTNGRVDFYDTVFDADKLTEKVMAIFVQAMAKRDAERALTLTNFGLPPVSESPAKRAVTLYQPSEQPLRITVPQIDPDTVVMKGRQ